MGKILLLIGFTLFYPVLMFAGAALNWIVSNPTLHTKEVGYLPWVVIAFGIFVSVKLSNQKLK